jgi:hypothetical protein
MNNNIETLKKSFKVLVLSRVIEIECPVCHSRWIIPKRDVKRGAGVLHLLNHEYMHKNQSL